MGIDQPEEVVALGLTFVVHVAGAVLLVWAMLGDEGRRGLRGWWPRDDGPDDTAPPGDPEPRPSGDRVALPLPGATSAPVRLREPVRIGDGYPRPRRRPEHAPEPVHTPDRG